MATGPESKPGRASWGQASSQPDLVTADAGHTIDVAQHGKADETCVVQDARMSHKPQFLGGWETPHPLGVLGTSRGVQERVAGTSAGEEAAVLRLLKFRTAVGVHGHLLGGFPCRMAKWLVPRKASEGDPEEPCRG